MREATLTDFKPGLEGVIAFETEIAEPDKAGGALRYRGVDIEDLIGQVSFGNVWALLVDGRFGHVVNQDLAEYHIPTNADVGDMDVSWIDEDDPYVNPMGSKGIGEIGIVGSAAAIANAVYHATGIRVRDLPITPDKLLS